MDALRPQNTMVKSHESGGAAKPQPERGLDIHAFCFYFNTSNHSRGTLFIIPSKRSVRESLCQLLVTFIYLVLTTQH